MKRLIIGFALGVAAGIWAYRSFQQGKAQETIHALSHSMATNADRVGTVIQEKVSEIRTEDIKRELEHGGVVIREKVRQAGGAIWDATANARLTGLIKGKLLTEAAGSALAINVDSTDGVVTLSGTVNSSEQVAKAVKIAMETDGVQKVISTLQVKPK